VSGSAGRRSEGVAEGGPGYGATAVGFSGCSGAGRGIGGRGLGATRAGQREAEGKVSACAGGASREAKGRQRYSE
jgi:hypothetical protein